MKLVANKFNTEAYNPSNEETKRFLTFCFQNLRALLEFEPYLVSEQEWFEKGNDPDELADLQLEKLEKASVLLTIGNLGLFAESCVPVNTNVVRRLKSAVHAIQLIKDGAETILLPYLPMEGEEVTFFRDTVYKAIAELSFFLYYQFEFPILQESLDTDETVINISLQMYLDDKGISPEEIYDYITSSLNGHMPSIPLLDNFPDMYEVIRDLAGPYIMDLEYFESFITPQMVQGLIDGKLDPEKMVTDLEKVAQTKIEKDTD